MRPFTGTLVFLLASVGFSGRASAHVPLFTPRVSLSLALDWNKLAVEAIAKPKPTAPARVGRHAIPKLTVTTAAPAPPMQLDFAAYGRVEFAIREVVIPHYVQPDIDHRQMFRQFYFSPYTPYLGAWGFAFTVETNALLR